MTYEDDIPEQLACDAHRGTSFVPEERGRQERADYAETLRRDRESLERFAGTPEKRAVLDAEFARYREGFRVRTLAELSAKSRCVSTMIAGPAKFNARRAEKRNDAADKRVRELLEYRERALRAIQRALCPEAVPIMSSDADAGDRYAAKIAEAEKRRDEIKVANAAARKAGQEAPYAAWELTNLGANIRRMKQRVKIVAKAQVTPGSIEQGAAARLEDCPPENRIRLFFPGKPAEDIRARLKSRGFRWTPSLGCWQAYRNPYALDSARQFAQIQEAKS